MRALIDTNVIIDALQRREPWFQEASAIFLAVANQQVVGCLTTKQAADIHFFSRKQFRGQDSVDAQARQVLSKLLGLFELIDTLAIDCQTALTIENGDYEDAILQATAQRSGVDCIVTRNAEHFKASPVAVYSPEAFLQILSKDTDL